jgi:cbb3-type cytochrome oxidase maturation protein
MIIVPLLLLPLALLLAGGFGAAFAWQALRGQWDELETPALRILLDDPATTPDRSAQAEAASPKRPARAEAALPERLKEPTP